MTHLTKLLTVLFAIACLLAGAMLPAVASASELPSRAKAQQALAAAQRALAPERLSAPANPERGSREATAALRDLAVALPALSRQDRARAQGLLARPSDRNDRYYFGREAPASPRCNAHFCVHWSNGKRSAPSSARFVDEVVAATDRSFAIENVQLGWRRPKPDGSRGMTDGRGGEGQVDVYITNLGARLYGFAAPDPRQDGSRRFAYLVLDNNYVGFPSPPLASMRVTVAHEYNHILHFNYDTFEDLWMFEATATWMEQQVYPGIDDYLNYLPDFAHMPERPLTGGSKVYADNVWNHWLESRYGAAVVRDAWAASTSVRPKHDSVASYEASIDAHGGRSFSREVAKFAATTAEWKSSRAFPDARRYPDMQRDGRLTAKPIELSLDNTSYRLFSVRTRSRKPLRLVVRAQRRTRSSVALVARNGSRRFGRARVVSRYLPYGGRASVRLRHPGSYERITAVVTNADGRGTSARRTANDSRYSVRLKR